MMWSQRDKNCLEYYTTNQTIETFDLLTITIGPLYNGDPDLLTEFKFILFLEQIVDPSGQITPISNIIYFDKKNEIFYETNQTSSPLPQPPLKINGI